MNKSNVNMNNKIRSNDSGYKCFDYVSLNDSDNCFPVIKQEINDPLDSCLDNELDDKKGNVQCEVRNHGPEKLSTLNFYMDQDNLNLNDNIQNQTSHENAMERKSQTTLEFVPLLRPFYSEVHPKSFNRSPRLKHHMNTHLSKEFYKCDICGKCYNTKSNLKLHVSYKHSGDKPYSCEYCGKTYTQENILKYHKLIHSGERLYPCDLCNKAFRSGLQLEAHHRRHTEERPYTCEECGKEFKFPSQLLLHSKLHTEERPYACEECGKEFKVQSYLLEHRKIHTEECPYSCAGCGKRFKLLSDLRSHRRKHVGGPYVCEICNKALWSSQGYKNHVNLHKTKKHTCSVCSKVFVRSGDLFSHSLVHVSKCQICFVYFPNETELKLHLEEHSELKSELYICYCGEVFANELELVTHEKVHL